MLSKCVEGGLGQFFTLKKQKCIIRQRTSYCTAIRKKEREKSHEMSLIRLMWEAGDDCCLSLHPKVAMSPDSIAQPRGERKTEREEERNNAEKERKSSNEEREEKIMGYLPNIERGRGFFSRKTNSLFSSSSFLLSFCPVMIGVRCTRLPCCTFAASRIGNKFCTLPGKRKKCVVFLVFFPPAPRISPYFLGKASGVGCTLHLPGKLPPATGGE